MPVRTESIYMENERIFCEKAYKKNPPYWEGLFLRYYFAEKYISNDGAYPRINKMRPGPGEPPNEYRFEGRIFKKKSEIFNEYLPACYIWRHLHPDKVKKRWGE